MLWVLHGSLIHLLLEKFGGSSVEHAERTVKSIINGWVVSATLDYIQEGDCLTDYKYTSVWSSKDGVKDEWEKQLNVGLYLLRKDAETAQIGAAIKKLAICIWYRDWRTSERNDFPNEIEVLPVDVWPEAKAKAYIEERVSLHQQFDGDGIPPMCSDHERWLKDFAIMKNDRKTAVRAKFKTREEAEAALIEFKCDYIREAAPKRCIAYCAYGMCGFCPYWNPETQQVRQAPKIAAIPDDEPKGINDEESRARKDGGNGP
jgi:hypothetical protein